MLIKTARLDLKIIEESDKDSVFQTLNFKNTAEIISFFSWPMTMEQAEKWCRRSIEGSRNKTDYMFIARRRDDGKPAGYIGLHFPPGETRRLETGYWVSEPLQGQGYALEMLKAMIDTAFNTFKVDLLFATTAMDNPASVNILEKHGFRLAGQKEVPLSDGSLRPSHLFELRSGG